MKLFLTGATGYIGSRLALRLVSEGHELGIVVRPDSRFDMLQAALPKIQVHVYDGSIASLLRALELTKPELVFHVASLFLAQHNSEDVAHLIESNLIFPTQLLEAMSKLGIKRFINTGTSWQHFQNELQNPVNLYAGTKLAFESLLAYYVEAQDFRAITLKLFDTYGPGDARPKLFSLLRKTARTAEILKMSPGEQLLDLVYIDDVIDAFLLMLVRLGGEVKSESYAVSNAARLSLRELVTIYSEVVGREVPVDWGGLSYRTREVLMPWTGTERVPGWQPRVSLREGIVLMENDERIDGLLSRSLK